jgi:hypothetical protein
MAWFNDREEGETLLSGNIIMKLKSMAGYLNMVLHCFKRILHCVQDDSADKGTLERKQRRFVRNLS